MRRSHLLLLCTITLFSATALAVIPDAAKRYRPLLTRIAHAQWGLSAPVATFAAQVHQESHWRSDARSPVGAMGLGQVMPSTATWLASMTPALADQQPYNPGWNLRALVSYDRWLYQRVYGANECERMAKTLSAYNGGLGWVYRDQKLAAQTGLDSGRWFDSVERVNAGRSAAAFRENRGYPRVILLTNEPLYLRAGWGPGSCL